MIPAVDPVNQLEQRVVQPIPSIKRKLEKPAQRGQQRSAPPHVLELEILVEQARQLLLAEVMMPHDPVRLSFVARLTTTTTDQRRDESEDSRQPEPDVRRVQKTEQTVGWDRDDKSATRNQHARHLADDIWS